MSTNLHHEYEPTGLASINQIPTHWYARRLGQIGTFTKGSGGNKDDATDYGLPCIRYGDIYTSYKYHARHARSYISKDRAPDYARLKHGDALFAASGETVEDIGKSVVNLMTEEAYCGPDVILFRPEAEINPSYLGYVLDCPQIAYQKSCMGRGITIMHIYSSSLKYITIPLPPLDEQAAIARYLDHADELINRYISAKERLIALLEEQRQAVIHQAVTRGIDPKVNLRPSGAHWLGDVPEHWEMCRSKRLFSPRRELARPHDIQLSATQAFGVIPQDDYEQRVGKKVVKVSLHLDKRLHVEVDDFVISMRSFQGGLERAWSTGCIRSSYVILRPTSEVDVGFFTYLFKSQAYIQALQSTGNFIRDGQDLNFNNFRAVDLPLPPAQEQREIAAALQIATDNIDTNISGMRRQIHLMHEYRTRLIADVVTGQLDVRDAAVELPD